MVRRASFLRGASPGAWFELALASSFFCHVTLVLAAVFFRGKPPTPSPEVVYDVELASPAGVIRGEVQGTGARMAAVQAAHPPPHAQPPQPRHAPTEPGDLPGEKVKPNDAANPQPTASVDIKKLHGAAMRDAVAKSMLAPADSPSSAVPGEGTAAPLGTPGGTPGGTGTGKAGMSADYRAVLGGWFASHFVCRQLNLPWEEMKELRTSAQVSLSPEGHITSFSVGGGSNPTHTACVQTMLQQLQGSGASLPPSPDGDPPPPNMNLVFRCRTQAQCT